MDGALDEAMAVAQAADKKTDQEAEKLAAADTAKAEEVPEKTGWWTEKDSSGSTDEMIRTRSVLRKRVVVSSNRRKSPR